MPTRLWCVSAALLLISVPARSQTVLSEADALARLSADSPRVRAIRAAVELARADVLGAARWPNPRMTFNRESVSGVTEKIWTVAQSLPITGRRSLDIDAASALVEASALRADDEVRRARAELRLAFANLVSAQLREAQFVQVRDRLRDLSLLLAKRETAGETSGYDRLRAEREVMDIEADFAGARSDRLRAQGELAAFFTGIIDATTLTAAVPARLESVPLPTIEELSRHALTVRGEATALEKEIASAQFATQAADRRLIPEPELVAGTKSSNIAHDLGTVFSVHATIPLFDRAAAERAVAHGRLVQAQSRAAVFRQTVAAQITALRSLVIERRESANRYRTLATESAAQLERIAQVSYEAGERGILELLDAYRSGAAARGRQAELDAAARRAEIELEFVSGWEIQ